MSIPATHGVRAAFESVTRSLFLVATLVAVAACGGGDAGDVRVAPAAQKQYVLKAATVDPALVPQAVNRVNTTLPGDQIVRAIGAVEDGGVAVAWLSTGEPGTPPGSKRLLLQRHDADGAKVGAETLVPFDFAAQPNPAVAVLSDASVVLAYSSTAVISSSPSEYIVRKGISTQRFDASGALVAGPTEVVALQLNLFANPTQTSFLDPSVTTLSDGSYLVGWTYKVQEPPYLPSMQFLAQRYDNQGAAVAGPRVVGMGGGGWGVQSAAFTALEDGGFLAALRHLDLGVESMVFIPFDSPERSAAIPAAGSGKVYPVGTSLLPLSSSGYVLWSKDQGVPFAQILDNGGGVIAAPSIEQGAAQAALSNGGFVVFWNDAAALPEQQNLSAQRYDSAGAPLGNVILMNTQRATPSIASVAESGVALAWTAAGVDTGLDVFMQLLMEQATPWQATVRACRAAAAVLHGAQHRQFMRKCLKGA